MNSSDPKRTQQSLNNVPAPPGRSLSSDNLSELSEDGKEIKGKGKEKETEKEKSGSAEAKPSDDGPLEMEVRHRTATKPSSDE